MNDSVTEILSSNRFIVASPLERRVARVIEKKEFSCYRSPMIDALGIVKIGQCTYY